MRCLYCKRMLRNYNRSHVCSTCQMRDYKKYAKYKAKYAKRYWNEHKGIRCLYCGRMIRNTFHNKSGICANCQNSHRFRKFKNEKRRCKKCQKQDA